VSDVLARQIPRAREIAAVVTARVGSDRFPGKVILPLAGHPLWWHVLQRAIAAATTTGAEIVGAGIITSKEPRNDILEAQARQYGVDCIRGRDHKEPSDL